MVALILAICLLVQARPRQNNEYFQTQVYVKDVEALSPDDIHRTHPYEVTVLLPAWETTNENEYHEIVLNPTDLNPGRAREAQRSHQALDAWVSRYDSRDILFEKTTAWNTKGIHQAIAILVAQFVASAACLFNLPTITNADPWFVFMFPLVVGVFIYFAVLAIIKSIRNFILWTRLSSNPVTVPARIAGIRQKLGHNQNHQNGYEVSILWEPLGMPVQYSEVQVPASRRRTMILLQRLVKTQLDEEAKGNFRVQPTYQETQSHTEISKLLTANGSTTIKITALPPSDPRSDPRPPRVRQAAEKARAKREAQLLAQREAFEEATAKARIEAAEHAELGSIDHSLEQLATEGPQAWYFPTDLSRVNLMGFDTGTSESLRVSKSALLWLILGIICGIVSIYLGFLHPEVMFPVYESPNPGYEPLGKWQ